ncbi:MAG: hypothetical protein JWO15_2672 [Sphingomonadales bacterium]|nr:hypothetical protein [Sphingomonadales bacterium]
MPQASGIRIVSSPRRRLGLRGLWLPLTPYIDEVGIDRMTVRVNANWRWHGDASRIAPVLADYREYLGTFDERFERPGSAYGKFRLKTRRAYPSTISSATFAVHTKMDITNNVTIDLAVNPTRTLEHLLHAHRGVTDFIGRVANLDCEAFFAETAGVVSGADDWDNLITDPRMADFHIGPDLFERFLPVFILKLQHWVEGVLVWNEYQPVAGWHAGVQTISHDQFVLTIRWAEVLIRQVEVYFERRVLGAHAVVERLARTALASLNDVHARRYDNAPDELQKVPMPIALDRVRRRSAGLAVGAKLTDDRRFTIYAKDHDRIRFELKYDSYPGTNSQEWRETPQQSLIARLTQARHSLLAGMRWSEVGAMCVASPQPSLADCMALIETVSAVASEAGTVLAPGMIHDLIVSGGLSIPSGSAPALMSAVRRLAQAGVLDQRRVRPRDRSGISARFALSDRFLSVRQRLIDAFETT